jgi:large subunit ribosomal protein L46
MARWYSLTATAAATTTPPPPPRTTTTFTMISASYSSSTNLLSSSSSYYAKKQERKQKRIAHYQLTQDKLQRLPHRRKNKDTPQGMNNPWRKAFRKYFIQKKVDEEYMNRKARQQGLDWQINVAVLLERQCVVMPDKRPWEIEMEQLQMYLNQYGKTYPKALLGGFDAAAFLESQKVTNSTSTPPLTDEELLQQHLPEGFVPAPRETPADASGNVRTTERKLKTSLYLTVQHQDDDHNYWSFPTVSLQSAGAASTIATEEGETLLDAGKRALATHIGPEVEYWTLSNCPCAVDMVALPTEDERQQLGYYGTKTFFMKFVHDEGQVSESSMKVKDYAWLDRHEMTERVQSQQGDYVAKFYHYLL